MSKKDKALVIILIGLLVLVLPLVFGCTPSPSQGEVITLKYSNPQPATSCWAVVDVKVLDKIEKETNGRIKFDRYFGGTLTTFPQSVTDIASGVADLGTAFTSVAPEGFDIGKAVALSIPNMFSASQARKVHEEVKAKYPDTFVPWELYGKPLSFAFDEGFHMSMKETFTKADDLKGKPLKISIPQIPGFKELGVDCVMIPPSETYVALEKGTVDGLTTAWEMLESQRYGEVTDYHVVLNFGDPAGMVRLMNWDSWNKLPSDIQKVIEDNYKYWGEESDKKVAELTVSGINFAESEGGTFHELAPEELQKIYAAMDKASRDNMAKLDEQGLPATEIYEMCLELAEKYK
jgi:TRAP-type C4-dicarboxylate transport system substrate-binding protein